MRKCAKSWESVPHPEKIKESVTKVKNLWGSGSKAEKVCQLLEKVEESVPLIEKVCRNL